MNNIWWSSVFSKHINRLVDFSFRTLMDPLRFVINEAMAFAVRGMSEAFAVRGMSECLLVSSNTMPAGAHFQLDCNRTNVLDNTNSIGHLS